MSNHAQKKVVLGIIFLILSLFYTVLFFNFAAPKDIIFNIAHIKSLTNILSSPINFDYWNHSGSLINLYSPWLTISMGNLFLHGNMVIGFLIFFGVITYLTVWSAYHYMHQFSQDTFEALLFSIFYTLSMNRILLVFQEQRIENYLVMIFLPMFYYGVFQIFSGRSRHWLNFTFGLAMILWTSPYVALAVVLTVIPVVFLILFNKVSHHWQYWGQLILALLKSLVLFVFLTIGFIGPLIENQLSKKIVQNHYHNFNYLAWIQKFHLSQTNLYLLLFTVALILLLLGIVFLKSPFSYKVIMLELIPLIYFSVVKINLPYDFSRLILAFRTIIDFFLILVAIRIIMLLFQESPAVVRLLIVLVAVVMMGSGNYFFAQSQQTLPLKINQKINYHKIVTNYHDQAARANNHYLINGNSQKIQFFTKGGNYWIQYYNSQVVTMDIPIQMYPGNQITVNNERTRIKRTDLNTVQLRTDPNKNIIEVHSHHTLIAFICLLLNGIGFVSLLYLFIHQKQRKNKKID
ncbi:hypothetical protein [Companilactobacillus sp. HBUAS56257]|uniref:hypothetical protein n=1 Tax=Companilactobacillus sp. HBUAS56257 TaxID=3109360 RepID=UPI002FF2D33A